MSLSVCLCVYEKTEMGDVTVREGLTSSPPTTEVSAPTETDVLRTTETDHDSDRH